MLPRSLTLTKIVDSLEFVCIFQFKQLFIHFYRQQLTQNLFFALSCPPLTTKGEQSTILAEKKHGFNWILGL